MSWFNKSNLSPIAEGYEGPGANNNIGANAYKRPQSIRKPNNSNNTYANFTNNASSGNSSPGNNSAVNNTYKPGILQREEENPNLLGLGSRNNTTNTEGLTSVNSKKKGWFWGGKSRRASKSRKSRKSRKSHK